MTNLTRLSLSHNRISFIPPSLADLENLEILTLFNNHIDELPTSLSSLPKLRILNLGSVRARGFVRNGADLTAMYSYCVSSVWTVMGVKHLCVVYVSADEWID